MKRRTLLGLVAVNLGAGTAVIGSGAFSSTEAERTVSVEVVPDYDAYLALESRIDGERSRIGDYELRLQFPGLSDEADGDGVGADSVYEFHDSGFVVTNQGTNGIEVYLDQDDSNGPTIEVYEHDDPDRDAIDKENPYELPVGEELIVGTRIDTSGVDTGNYDETLQIIGEET